MSTKEDNAKTNTEKWHRHSDESHNYFKTHCSFSGNKEECVDEILCSIAYCCYDPLLRDQETKVHVTSAISLLPHIQTKRKKLKLLVKLDKCLI